MRLQRFRWLSIVCAFVLVASACGSDGDSDGSDVTPDATGTENEPADAATPEEEPPEEETPDEEASAEEVAEEEPAEDSEAGAAVEPQYGDSLTYLLEAETDTWDIPNANCAVSCITVMRAVADAMTIINEDGEPEPFLLESFTNDDGDFREWTLVMRDGVIFHDGTPVDGAAIQRNLVEISKEGTLTSQLMLDLENGTESIELVDDMTVKVTFSRPVSVFPLLISDRVGGWVMSPAFWDDPNRAGALPISTGPFEMIEWTRDERTVLQRNEDYWRTDAAGNQLPYLDEVVFRPVPDDSARLATMEAGDADVNMDSSSVNGEFWQVTWPEQGGQLVEPYPSREVSYLLLNNGAPPFDNPDIRRALALCTDREEYIAFRAPGSVVADGPFAEGELGYLEETGFPDFDPAAGTALLDEVGRPDVINYGFQDTPANRLTAELFADQWNGNCGLNVQINGFDQSELITRAVIGSFELFQWRNHGQGNPGLEEPWWHSRHTEGLALNFGRIIDPTIDELLDETWATDETEELDALGQEINARFGQQVYNLWLNITEWVNAYAGDVHGVGFMTLESGNPVQGAITGRTWIHEAWKES